MNNIFKTFYCLLFFCSAFTTIGQDEIAKVDSTHTKFSLKYSIDQHFRFGHPKAQIGAEIKLTNRIGLNIETGFTHERFNLFNAFTGEVYQNKRKVRGNQYGIELRVYPSKKSWVPSGFFFAIRQSWIRSTITREEQISRFDFEYFEEFDIEITNRSSAQSLLLGFKFYHKNRFNLEFQHGIGLKTRDYQINIPDDASRLPTSDFMPIAISDDIGRQVYPEMFFALKVTWNIIY